MRGRDVAKRPEGPSPKNDRCLKDNQTVDQPLSEEASGDLRTPFNKDRPHSLRAKRCQCATQRRSLDDLHSSTAKIARAHRVRALGYHSHGSFVYGADKRRIERESSGAVEDDSSRRNTWRVGVTNVQHRVISQGRSDADSDGIMPGAQSVNLATRFFAGDP